MRFRRRPRPEGFTWTPRKEAAARRSLERQALALPLFAEQIRAEQPSVEEIRSRRAAAWIESEKVWRKRHADNWREARRRLRCLVPELRVVFIQYWDNHRWLPHEPLYLMSLIHRPPAEVEISVAAIMAAGCCTALAA